MQTTASKKNIAGVRSGAIVLIVAGLFACALAVLFWADIKSLLQSTCSTVVPGKVCESAALRELFGSYLFGALALPLAFLLESLIPARQDQRILSTGFRQDIAWLLLNGISRITLIAAFAFLLYTFYNSFLGFARIDIVTSLPMLPQIVVVILLSDFLAWMHHWVRHKVPFFWQFHKVHHSQREMNYFCDARIHPFDSLFARLISFIPFYSLELDLAVPVFVAWQAFSIWYARLYHGNIRMNLGPLRYFLVTPQSHRVHHSIEREHQDKNFAVIFSIWDFIFGTQHLGFDDYPDTGVQDTEFPLEQENGPVQILKTWLLQVFYPFKAVFRNR